MATHFDSKLTHLAVTSPLDSKTGRSSSRRQRRNVTLAAKFSQSPTNDTQAQVQPSDLSQLSHPQAEDEVYGTIQSRDVTTDEIYEQLQRMKFEHRKTLRQIEAVYNRARGLADTQTNLTYRESEERIETTDEDERQEPVTALENTQQTGDCGKETECDESVGCSVENGSSDGTDTPWMDDDEEADWRTLRWMAEDKLVDMSQDHQQTEETDRDESSGTESLEEDKHQPEETSGFSSQIDDESPIVKAVQDMWQDFSVDDYRFEDDNKRSQSDETKWFPQITIPEPFQMTIREETKALKTGKKKSKVAEELEEKRLQKEAEEEAELRKKFKARPMPASAMVPLYEEMQERDEMRRAHMKAMSRQLLQSTEKPFSFIKREQKRKLQRRQAALQKLAESQVCHTRVTKARPVPKEIFDPHIDEEIKEEEEYRRIRIKMRAEEMLAKASLPSSMKVKGRHYTVGNLRYNLLKNREKQAFLTEDHRFHPKVNQAVPDFDEQREKFDQEMAALKRENQTTTVEPFYLRTELIPSHKQRVLNDIEQDKDTLPETRWPFTLPRKRVHLHPGTTYIASPDSMISRSTKSSELRENSTRSSLNETQLKENREKAEELHLAAKQRLLAKAVAKKSKVNDHRDHLKRSSRQKLIEFLENDQERKIEYRRELEEMEDRLSRRPFLFERESQINARRAAQLKYTRALRNAGLDDRTIDELDGYKDDSRQASVALARGRRLEQVEDYHQDSDQDDSDSA
ncbi:protein FAM161A-like [Corticium candelabrum]|uniref:protein FAM161A-like n=1 Tax=Corticium candelabrum TaxID=121492 RepID=UPI002E259205|nr:protein FAM161A-like [Corticium candelabrum]